MNREGQATRPEFDPSMNSGCNPEYINKLLQINVDRIRELERALLEAQKAMTMLAATLASVAGYLPEGDQAATDNADWLALNRAAR